MEAWQIDGKGGSIDWDFRQRVRNPDGGLPSTLASRRSFTGLFYFLKFVLPMHLEGGDGIEKGLPERQSFLKWVAKKTECFPAGCCESRFPVTVRQGLSELPARAGAFSGW